MGIATVGDVTKSPLRVSRRVVVRINETRTRPPALNDFEMQMTQGFSLFVMTWGDSGFQATEIPTKVVGR